MQKISKAEADKLWSISNNKLKKRLVNLFFKDNADILPDNPEPIAVVMAGLPGSGKTEFLNEFFKSSAASKSMLRVDLDEVVKMFADYEPNRDELFRLRGNLIVEGIFDYAVNHSYNFALDGTLGGSKSVHNIRRLREKGYDVQVFVMNEKVEQAWQYTLARQKKTGRRIERSEFDTSIKKIKGNLTELIKLPRSADTLGIWLVDKNMQTSNYALHTLDLVDIDNMFDKS